MPGSGVETLAGVLVDLLGDLPGDLLVYLNEVRLGSPRDTGIFPPQ